MIALVLFGCPADPVEVPLDTASPAGDPTDPVVVSSTPCDACGGDCVVEELLYAERLHTTEPITYTSTPPAGGPHDPCWSVWGVHQDPVEDDRWVHNLEHGGVVFLHDCVDCDAELTALEALSDTKGVFTLVTPYPGMETPFAAVAWQWRMLAGCVDDAAFGAFYDAHVDQAPESITGGPALSCE